MTTRTSHLFVLPILLALALHWLGLSWLQANMPNAQTLLPMREPLFTRVLEPAITATVAAAPIAQAGPLIRAAKKTTSTRKIATPADSPVAAVDASKQPGAAEQPVAQNDAARRDEDMPPGDTKNAAAEPTPEVTAQTPAMPETQAEPKPEPQPSLQQDPQAVTQANDSLASWPLDTRLSYKVGGFFRGELHGDARVQWQRDKSAYQVMVTVTTLGLTLATLTSQGEATAAGLVPRVYEEKVPGGLRRVEFSEGQVKFQNGNLAPLPAGAQDTVSQLVDLTHRFTSGRSTLAMGVPVHVWLARPGGLDEWIYDVGEQVTLQTPQLGPIQAFHLRPRPLANPRGPITVEMWFAPSLQYLPVRVRIVAGEGNFLDLMIERIEQAAGAQATTRAPAVSIQ